MDKNGILRCGVVQMLSIKVPFQKLKRDVSNLPTQAEAKRDGVINPQNYNFKQF